MKKLRRGMFTILLLLLSFGVLTACGDSFYKFIKDNGNTSFAGGGNYIAPELNIDGVLDEAEWLGGDVIHTAFGKDNTSVSAKIYWGEAGIYFGFTAADATLVSAVNDGSGYQIWENDSLEIYLDTLNLGAAAVGSGVVQINADVRGKTRLLMGTTSGYFGSWGGSVTVATVLDGTLNDAKDVDTGYTTEIMVSYKALKITKDSKVGVTFAVVDKLSLIAERGYYGFIFEDRAISAVSPASYVLMGKDGYFHHRDYAAPLYKSRITGKIVDGTGAAVVGASVKTGQNVYVTDATGVFTTDILDVGGADTLFTVTKGLNTFEHVIAAKSFNGEQTFDAGNIKLLFGFGGENGANFFTVDSVVKNNALVISLTTLSSFYFNESVNVYIDTNASHFAPQADDFAFIVNAGDAGVPYSMLAFRGNGTGWAADADTRAEVTLKRDNPAVSGAILTLTLPLGDIGLGARDRFGLAFRGVLWDAEYKTPLVVDLTSSGTVDEPCGYFRQNGDGILTRMSKDTEVTGTANAGAEVVCTEFSKSVTADGSGRYAIALPLGNNTKYSLTFRKKGFDSVTLNGVLPASVQNVTLEQSAVPPEEATFSGKVTDVFGKPLVGARISVKGASAQAVSDQNGAYTVTCPTDGSGEVLQIETDKFSGFQSAVSAAQIQSGKIEDIEVGYEFFDPSGVFTKRFLYDARKDADGLTVRFVTTDTVDAAETLLLYVSNGGDELLDWTKMTEYNMYLDRDAFVSARTAASGSWQNIESGAEKTYTAEDGKNIVEIKIANALFLSGAPADRIKVAFSMIQWHSVTGGTFGTLYSDGWDGVDSSFSQYLTIEL